LGEAVNAGDIIMRTTQLLAVQGETGELSAKQLRDFLNDFGVIMVQAIQTAHCDHDGSRWMSRGKTYCGLCNREIADELRPI
jgi:hypothetical protein